MDSPRYRHTFYDACILWHSKHYVRKTWPLWQSKTTSYGKNMSMHDHTGASQMALIQKKPASKTYKRRFKWCIRKVSHLAISTKLTKSLNARNRSASGSCYGRSLRFLPCMMSICSDPRYWPGSRASSSYSTQRCRYQPLKTNEWKTSIILSGPAYPSSTSSTCISRRRDWDQSLPNSTKFQSTSRKSSRTCT